MVFWFSFNNNEKKKTSERKKERSIFSGLLDAGDYSLMDNAEGGCLCFQFTRGRHIDFTILSPFLND